MFGEDLNGDNQIGFNVNTLTIKESDSTGDQLALDSEGALFILPEGGNVIKIADEWGGNVYLENSWSDDYGSSSQEAYQVEFSTEDNLYILAVKDSWSNSYGGQIDSNEQWNIYKLSLIHI